jgi:hypothetical protein
VRVHLGAAGMSLGHHINGQTNCIGVGMWFWSHIKSLPKTLNPSCHHRGRGGHTKGLLIMWPESLAQVAIEVRQKGE